MWSKASSSFALLLAVLAASASVSVSAQNAATGSDVLVTMPIQIDGSFKDLQLMRGESVEDAAVSFARNNGLLTNRDATRVREVVDQLSGLLRGRMEEIRATEPAPKPTVQLSMPLTIDGTTRELKKLEGESVEAAVERYLYDGGYTMDVMRQLYPQLVNVVQQKLEELKPARKELFSFTLTIDGREAITRHFENGDPMEEARETLRGVDIVDSTVVERLVPQIANEIRKRIPESSPAPAQPVAAQPGAAQAHQPAAAPANELFSIPLTVNEKPTVLVHYEGYTSRESAVRYLNENGLANADTAAQMVIQLVQIIDSRIAEIARETQAAQEAAAARAKAEQEQQQAAARASQEAAAATPRQPTVRLPVNFGNDQAATLDYYEGDSVERTVELFLTQIGMQESSTFAQNVEALASAVRKEYAAIVAKREAAQASTSTPPQEQEPQQQPQPLITLPVTLSGRVFDLVYFAGEQPATVANAFCVEKHEIIRTEMGLQFDGDQLLECKTLLDQTLRNLIAQKQTEQPAAAQPAAPTTHSRGEFLFSLDIELNNANVPLTMHQNDNAEQVARAFCEQHKIDLANVAPLVRALNEQLARLK